MGIRVKNATRRYTSEMCIAAAVGMEDEYGNPFELVTLEWTPNKRNYHQAKTKGFEDAFIERLPGGGLDLSYRQPGSAEWQKSGLTGRFMAQVPKTPHNMNMLTSMYYDKLWRIREPHVDAEVKARADKLDELLKQEKIPIIKTRRVVEPDPETGEDKVVFREMQVGEESMYDFHKRRREGHFRRQGEQNDRMVSDLHDQKMEILDQKMEIFKQRETLNKIRGELVKEQGNLSAHQKAFFDQGGTLVKYKEEALGKMKMADVRRIARQEFGLNITVSMKKVEIIEQVMAAQNNERKEEPVGAVTG